MWCPQCKKKSPSVAVGNDELICAECRTEIVPTIPKPKSRIKAQVTAKANRKGPNPASKSTATAPKPARSNPSTEAAIKAWTDTGRKWRADKAHLKNVDQDPLHIIDHGAQDVPPIPPNADPRNSRYHLILFGLFVFLAGHGLTIWAFLAAHFGAWTIGSFCSVGGIAIALISVVQALREMEQRLSESSTKSLDANAKSPRSTKKIRRVKRKKVRR